MFIRRDLSGTSRTLTYAIEFARANKSSNYDLKLGATKGGVSSISHTPEHI